VKRAGSMIAYGVRFAIRSRSSRKIIYSTRDYLALHLRRGYASAIRSSRTTRLKRLGTPNQNPQTSRSTGIPDHVYVSGQEATKKKLAVGGFYNLASGLQERHGAIRGRAQKSISC